MVIKHGLLENCQFIDDLPGFLHLLWLFQQATFDWQREYSPHPILYLQALDPCHCGKGWTSPMTELDLETSRLWSILAGKTMIVTWCMMIDDSHSWIFLNYKRTGSNIHLPVQNPVTGWNTGNWVQRLATARPVEKITYAGISLSLIFAGVVLLCLQLPIFLCMCLLIFYFFWICFLIWIYFSYMHFFFKQLGVWPARLKLWHLLGNWHTLLDKIRLRHRMLVVHEAVVDRHLGLHSFFETHFSICWLKLSLVVFVGFHWCPFALPSLVHQLKKSSPWENFKFADGRSVKIALWEHVGVLTVLTNG